ncbi:hypothetical protein INT47_002725 [Mucor saturninus]|uniref:Uncharacterized protein n=1 Tax=Mucor saturninus TaxID=64648 RepID=A0A8H7QS78_9FUNG|nr:hypothetical protein INT47_002725 [Mucor saturninus]
MVSLEPTLSTHTLLNNGQHELSDLQRSIIDSFAQVCSVEQMEICQRLGLLSKSEQQQTYKMAKSLIEHGHMPQDWNALTEWVIMLRERYTAQLELQNIRQITNDGERLSHLDKVQYLSGLLEEYGQAHDDLTDLLQALKKLRNDWKHRKRDVENIVLSILSSCSKNTEYRVVKVNRTHLATLGLGLGSIGKYYIIYENSMTDESKKDILNNLAKDFSMVFGENAAQNLARMAGSYQRIFNREEHVDLTGEIQKLSQQIHTNRPHSVILPYPPSLPMSSTVLDIEEGHAESSSHSPTNKRESTFLERRKSVILLDNDQDESTLFHMAKPLFEPAGWDWANILKYKRPRSRSSGSYYWCRQILSTHPSGNNEKAREQQFDGVWSTSISRLSEHFAKVGQEYYSNMLNNARLMHSYRAQMFEFATHSLLKTYRALQLEQGCANLSRTLAFLYRLEQESQGI